MSHSTVLLADDEETLRKSLAQVLEEAISIVDGSLGRDHRYAAVSRFNLGRVLHADRRFDQAEATMLGQQRHGRVGVVQRRVGRLRDFLIELAAASLATRAAVA